ncbi:MAG TPA: DHH family phosphoesterase, partial [Gemmatimonadaceae bacterium]|nr:DHH family phosphoesterase [Gemmatimonadaceae bacterium]
MSKSSFLDIPRARTDAIQRIAQALKDVPVVAVTTHINADGDAAGSVAAMARLLPQIGAKAIVVNPTPWPAVFGFLKTGLDDRTSKGAEALRGAGALVSLDVSDVKRLGSLAGAAKALPGPRIVIDHHVPTDEPAGDIVLADTEACATGELLYDFAMSLGLEIDQPIAEALYTAILTDTGGFRYSNTTPRTHAIAAQLIDCGVDPELTYRRIYASLSPGRLQLLRDALDTLGVDAKFGLAWVSVSNEAMDRYGVSSDDLDGIVEHPRSVAGTRVALFFRDLGYGKVKVSFRS